VTAIETKHRRWVVYDNTGRVVILCRDKGIAERYANSTRAYGNKEPRPPTRQSEDE